MDETQIVAIIIALVMSVVIHEMAHGYMANWLGDPTARLAGRLSGNPLVHLDPLMSVIIPGLLVLSGSPILFGAAKPVPYNPFNLRNQKWGEALVAAAGPASNIALAIIFALLVRFADVLSLNEAFTSLAVQIVMLNIFLALFNLVPIPPLDGSKILPRLLPYNLRMSYDQLRRRMEGNFFLSFAIIIILFVYVFSAPIVQFTLWVTRLMIGA